MDRLLELLACPACSGTLTTTWSCRACGKQFEIADGIPDLRIPGDQRTETVRGFYERTPFPGYPPRDSLHALRARAGRSEFARLMDQAIPAMPGSWRWDAGRARCACTCSVPIALSSAPI
jgi:uncharacterized protein YbaR (Trm112 family)